MIKPAEKKTLDKAISLSSALGYIENTFTDFNEPLDICEINLKYMLHPDYDPRIQRVNDPGVKLEGRLVWEFVITIPENYLCSYEIGLSKANAGEDFDPNKISYDDLRKYICVDVENGELFYEFEMNMLTYGG